jgi:hypothetical protein
MWNPLGTLAQPSALGAYAPPTPVPAQPVPIDPRFHGNGRRAANAAIRAANQANRRRAPMLSLADFRNNFRRTDGPIAMPQGMGALADYGNPAEMFAAYRSAYPFNGTGF